MKQILILITAFLFFSCGKNKKIEKKKINNTDNTYNMDFLDIVDEEKIALISTINNVPSKDIKSLVVKFLKKINYHLWNSIDCNSECYIKIIEEISKEFNLPKEKVSLIIFYYRFYKSYDESASDYDYTPLDIDYSYSSDSYDNFR